MSVPAEAGSLLQALFILFGFFSVMGTVDKYKLLSIIDLVAVVHYLFSSSIFLGNVPGSFFIRGS